MAVHNADIAAVFEEIADLLELGDENPFRIRAYRNAARVVGGLSLDLAARLAEGGELPKLPGIGEDLAGKIHEIAATGTCKLLEKLRGRFPAGITELLRLPGVGPKRVRALHEAKIDSLEDLRRAARAGRLPKLVRLEDLRGDLHAHTTASDGKSSLAEMAEAAHALGYEYLAITDHSRHATVARGLDPRRLARQIKAIDKLNAWLKGIQILKACEVDILADGTLDLPDAILADLDLRVCAIHYKFDLSEREQTERVIRAMDNRYFNILAHPTGRLLGERAAYPIDLERILKAAKERGCAIELNAHPTRLDIDDHVCRLAKDIGVSRREAQEFIDAYFNRYSGVRRFLDETVARARQSGTVRTLLGRLRRLPDLNARNPQIRMEAERQAVNTPCQGSAADLIKKAMIDLHRELRERKMKTRLILQIHDELLLEVPEAEAEAARTLVTEVMEGALALDVPLVVDARLGENWAEAH